MHFGSLAVRLARIRWFARRQHPRIQVASISRLPCLFYSSFLLSLHPLCFIFRINRSLSHFPLSSVHLTMEPCTVGWSPAGTNQLLLGSHRTIAHLQGRQENISLDRRIQVLFSASWLCPGRCSWSGIFRYSNMNEPSKFKVRNSMGSIKFECFIKRPVSVPNMYFEISRLQGIRFGMTLFKKLRLGIRVSAHIRRWY